MGNKQKETDETERSPKPTKSDIWNEVKQFQREENGEADSTKQFREAEHQARNDAQDSGEDLPNRDRTAK